METKQEIMLEVVRDIQDKVRSISYKVALIATVVSVAVGYLCRDLDWLVHLLGGL